MNIVELELDETLADFEIQDWIDNVFSVQFPEIKAKIKHGCSGICHKDKWYYMKNGILPEVGQLVLLYRKNPLGANIAITHWYESAINEKVIAWKSVELPEEIE